MYVRLLPGFPFLNREEHIRKSNIPDAWFRPCRRLRLCLLPMCRYSRQYTRKPGGLRLYIRNKSVNEFRCPLKWLIQTYEQSFYKLYILLADYSRYKSDNQTNHPDSRLQADRQHHGTYRYGWKRPCRRSRSICRWTSRHILSSHTSRSLHTGSLPLILSDRHQQSLR